MQFLRFFFQSIDQAEQYAISIFRISPFADLKSAHKVLVTIPRMELNPMRSISNESIEVGPRREIFSWSPEFEQVLSNQSIG